jgi:uncharacterized protein (TIGR02001 family)
VLIQRLRLAGLAVLVFHSAAVHAQLGGSIVAASDDRFRGVSLSGEEPSLRATLSYEHSQGGYAGLSLASAALESGPRRAASTAYAGYASRWSTGGAWDVGAVRTHFSGTQRDDYGEIYGGLTGDRWSFRLYYAPNYFGRDVRTVYLDLGAALPLNASLRAFAHLGVLTPVSGRPPDNAARFFHDVRVGLGQRLNAVDLQLAWVGSGSGDAYAPVYGRHRNSVVLSVACNF